MLLIGPIGVAELSVSEEYFKQLSAFVLRMIIQFSQNIFSESDV